MDGWYVHARINVSTGVVAANDPFEPTTDALEFRGRSMVDQSTDRDRQLPTTDGRSRPIGNRVTD